MLKSAMFFPASVYLMLAAANRAANERHNRYFTVTLPQNKSIRTGVGAHNLQFFSVSMVPVTDRNEPVNGY